VITDGKGVPLAVTLTGGNRNDVTQLLPLIEAIPPVRGRTRQRPVKVLADRAYDHDKYRALVRAKGTRPVIARRGVRHGSGLGEYLYWWNRPWRCSTGSGGCASARRSATTSTKHS
jgi:transposase